MRVLVSDTSVLIDLERGGFLEAAFSLSWQFAVPDLLFERELRLSSRLAEVRRQIADGRIARRFSQGQPYWVDLREPEAAVPSPDQE